MASVQETYGKGKQVVKSDDDNTEEIEKKLNEIDQFLVEMEAKIEELNTAKINREKAVPTPSEIALAEYVKMLTPSVESSSTVTNTGSSSSTSNIPINDLTSLIKRKVAANLENNIEGSNDNLIDENNVISTNVDNREEKKRKTDETTNEGGNEGSSEENKESSPNKKARLSG
ncbi:20001_t:CDS:2 [Funneliformis geosporum]|uniref:20001_t:CDS:1 n=1 Tax=Funneliformis geosporum TaxID=1117311 RepID=A0A9W4TBA5_9GLOM|nr:20001_t:CDS:2 [Funneliformis geosporum]